jgi:hypothetical protein
LSTTIALTVVIGPPSESGDGGIPRHFGVLLQQRPHLLLEICRDRLILELGNLILDHRADNDAALWIGHA